jgi:hypothetical protein
MFPIPPQGSLSSYLDLFHSKVHWYIIILHYA